MADFLPRATERKRCYLKARFVFNGGYSSLDALARDISRDGARIVADDMRDVPERFDLVIAGFGGATKTRPARRVWRANGAMGVAFLH